MLFSTWAQAAQGQLMGADIDVGPISTDSRTLAPGDIYCALSGERFDGHAFLADALAKGAKAFILERPDPSLPVPQLQVAQVDRALGQIAHLWRKTQFTGVLFAITGSCGKTTVKGLLAAIAQEAGPSLATLGNLNNHLGVPMTLLKLRPEHRYAVIEMGASGLGEIAYLAQMAQPQVALVNNVMPAHVEGFGSLAAIAREKQSIYQSLGTSGTAVINLDDPYSQDALRSTRASHQWAFSTQPTRALRHLAKAQDLSLSLATDARADAAGRMAFTWCIDGQQVPVQLQLIGQHNLGNALAAATLAYAGGIDPALIAAGLGRFSGEKGRMQAKTTPEGAILIDDTYNANPGSLAAAIDYLALCPSPRVLVLGDMKELGQDALAEHRRMGAYAAARGIEALFCCGDLSRATAEGFGQGGAHFDQQDTLLQALRARLAPGLTLLVKGSRSSRMENTVNGLLALGDH
jgi:UDP-N-acetylmuramoyl-tripeptide--D-alanyl-D-alanine ligase